MGAWQPAWENQAVIKVCGAADGCPDRGLMGGGENDNAASSGEVEEGSTSCFYTFILTVRSDNIQDMCTLV